MADQRTVERIKRRLDTAWEESTSNIRSRTEEESRRLRISSASGDQLQEKVNRLVAEAVEIEAEERAVAIASTVVNDLLNIIEAMEGRIEDLEDRLERLGSASPTSTPTTL